MKINKGLQMNNWLTQRFAMLALVAGTAFATEQTDEINAQLDSIDQAQTGVSFTGEMLSRGLSSEKYGTGLSDRDPSVENLFFSQMDLTIKGRPNRETEATLIFRLHQDWNNYYDEGVNPFNTRWMSYDGTVKIFDKDMSFNLGDFRFKKSPLVAYVPDLTGLEYEAEIFTRKREEAAADRFQGDNLRHLQGINTTYRLGNPKGTYFDMSATGAQLRFPWWSNGILQYDNDDAAKYLGHIDGAITIKQLIQGGASFTSIYDAVNQTRSHNRFNTAALDLLEQNQGLTYENNFVMSFFGGFDWNQLAPKSNIILNGRVDFAISTYEHLTDSLATPQTLVQVVDDNGDVIDTSAIDLQDQRKWILQDKPDQELDGTAILAELEFGYQQGSDAYIVNAWGIANDAEFVSDLAQSQGFMPRSVFNSANRNGLYGAANYASMFDALYNYAFTVQPVTERANLETYSPVEGRSSGYNGTNNYFRAGYQKNSYTNITQSQSERNEAAYHAETQLMGYFQDVLPGGKASANRAGGQVELSIDALDNMVSVDAHYGKFENMGSQEFATGNYQSVSLSSAEYTRMGAGVAVRLGGVLDYKDGIELTGGFGSDEAIVVTNQSMDRTTSFISGGLKVGFLENYEFIAGVQMLEHELVNSVVTGEIVTVSNTVEITDGDAAYSDESTYDVVNGQVSLNERTVITDGDTVTNNATTIDVDALYAEGNTYGAAPLNKTSMAKSIVSEMMIAAGVSAKLTKGTSISAEVSILEGESDHVTYTQVIPQVNLRMKF